jgi:uncharacterized protein YndB with AHSA1/START domain
MERKTHINAEDGKQELFITREFDLPVKLLFLAYTEARLLEQWMGNKVLKLENRKHGSYQFETSDQQGNVIFRANGTIHTFIPEQTIVRTFEMENTPFPVQLEYLNFEALDTESSKLTIHVIYKSVAERDMILQMPFAWGINRAHNQLQKIMNIKK